MVSRYAIQIILLVCCASFGSTNCDNYEPCPVDWIQYNDERCFKIIDDSLRTFDEAKDACSAVEPTSTLLVIGSTEEQQFLSNYLFKTEQKVENFWIGSQYLNGSFVWIDNSPLSNYTNWDAGHGSQSLENHCVHMLADERVAGKWKDRRWDKKNAVVCQMMPLWTIDVHQKTFLDARKQQWDAIRDLKQSLASANQRIEKLEIGDQKINELKLSLEAANARIDQLKQNFIPIGLLYTQLPNEKAPSEIWPWMTWTNVGSAYAGVFFRVVGSEAESFGQVQNHNSPKLSTVEFHNGRYADKVHLASGQCSTVSTAGYTGAWTSLQFCMSSGEVRPRNMAVHIWKRTG